MLSKIGEPITAADLYNPENAQFLNRDFLLYGVFSIDHRLFPRDQCLILIQFIGYTNMHACVLLKQLVDDGLPSDADFAYGDGCKFQFQFQDGALKMVCTHYTRR
ncbi:MAG: hypothetical protein RIQ72_298 [Candidatus Parcubacteria bacterium]|jgi:hypothetical protein